MCVIFYLVLSLFRIIPSLLRLTSIILVLNDFGIFSLLSFCSISFDIYSFNSHIFLPIYIPIYIYIYIPISISNPLSYTASEAPEYEYIVPLNMHLTLMRDRAINCHYRQPQSFLADARTVFSNAVQYNGEGSAIALRVSRSPL